MKHRVQKQSQFFIADVSAECDYMSVIDA